MPRRSRAVLRDVEPQGSTCDLAAMELLYGLLRVLFSGEANEGKAPRAPGFAVFWNVDIDDLTDFTEQLAKLRVRRGEVEVPYEYLV